MLHVLLDLLMYCLLGCEFTPRLNYYL